MKEKSKSRPCTETPKMIEKVSRPDDMSQHPRNMLSAHGPIKSLPRAVNLLSRPEFLTTRGMAPENIHGLHKVGPAVWKQLRDKRPVWRRQDLRTGHFGKEASSAQTLPKLSTPIPGGRWNSELQTRLKTIRSCQDCNSLVSFSVVGARSSSELATGTRWDLAVCIALHQMSKAWTRLIYHVQHFIFTLPSLQSFEAFSFPNCYHKMLYVAQDLHCRS